MIDEKESRYICSPILDQISRKSAASNSSRQSLRVLFFFRENLLLEMFPVLSIVDKLSQLGFETKEIWGGWRGIESYSGSRKEVARKFHRGNGQQGR